MKENFVISIWLYLIRRYCYWCCHTNLKRLRLFVHPIPKDFCRCTCTNFLQFVSVQFSRTVKFVRHHRSAFQSFWKIGVPAKNLNPNKLQIFCLLASCETNNKSMLPNTFDSAICIVMCVVATRSNCCPSCGQLLSIPFPTCQYLLSNKVINTNKFWMAKIPRRWSSWASPYTLKL